MLLGHLAAHLCTHASPRAGEVLTDRASVSSRLWPDQLGSSRRSKSPYLEAEAVAVSHPLRCALARLWISVRYAELSPLPPGGGGPGTATSLSFLRCQRGMDSGPPPSTTRKRGLVDAVFQKLVGDRFGSVPSHTLMRLLQVRRSAFRASSQRGVDAECIPVCYAGTSSGDVRCAARVSTCATGSCARHHHGMSRPSPPSSF